MTTVTRSRGWLLTQSADKMTKEELLSILEASTYPYVFQEEKGAEDGYIHFQIYIENPEPIRFSTLKKKFSNAHIEPRRGSRAQAYEYCTKEDTRLSGPYKGNGDIPVEDLHGKRTDLEALREMVFSGVPLSEILINEPSSAYYLKYLERLAYEQAGQKWSNVLRDISVTYMYGPTGSGKTRYIYDTYSFNEVFRVTDYTHPFDGYTGQDILVLDEYHGQLTSSLLLNVLDRYPLQLPARYNNIWAAFTKVYVVSNLEFSELYPNLQLEKPQVYAALERRIHDFKFVDYADDNK